MGISRYTFTPRILNGSILATSSASTRIYNGVMNGSISYSPAVIRESVRLDHIAANAYGSGDLWWVIAAASGIGWGLQLPPGTILRIPKSISQIMTYLR